MTNLHHTAVPRRNVPPPHRLPETGPSSRAMIQAGHPAGARRHQTAFRACCESPICIRREGSSQPWHSRLTAMAATATHLRLELLASVPLAWSGAACEVNDAIELIRQARDNIDGCLDEVRRVLS